MIKAIPSMKKPEITIPYGQTKRKISRYIYNIRVSYPNDNINLISATIKAALHMLKIGQDYAGFFSFMITGLYYFTSTTIVFGSNVSAVS